MTVPQSIRILRDFRRWRAREAAVPPDSHTIDLALDVVIAALTFPNPRKGRTPGPKPKVRYVKVER